MKPPCPEGNSQTIDTYQCRKGFSIIYFVLATPTEVYRLSEAKQDTHGANWALLCGLIYKSVNLTRLVVGADAYHCMSSVRH